MATCAQPILKFTMLLLILSKYFFDALDHPATVFKQSSHRAVRIVSLCMCYAVAILDYPHLYMVACHLSTLNGGRALVVVQHQLVLPFPVLLDYNHPQGSLHAKWPQSVRQPLACPPPHAVLFILWIQLPSLAFLLLHLHSPFLRSITALASKHFLSCSDIVLALGPLHECCLLTIKQVFLPPYLNHHNYELAFWSDGSTHGQWTCLLSQSMIYSGVSPPVYLTGPLFLSFWQNFMVGNPSISTPTTSFSVRSIFTNWILGLPASLRAAYSQSEAMALHCQHQGVQNSTRDYFSDSSTICLNVAPTATFTKPSLCSGARADLTTGYRLPPSTFLTNALSPSRVMSSSQMYFSCCSPRNNIWGVMSGSSPRYRVSLLNNLCPSLASEMARIASTLVSSSSWNTCLASSDSSLSEVNRNTVGRRAWKVFSMA